MIDCPAMYTFVIKNRESVVIEGHIFATYGHFMDNQIVKHDYFGTNKVINDLKKIKGYDNGLIELLQDNFIRDFHCLLTTLQSLCQSLSVEPKLLLSSGNAAAANTQISTMLNNLETYTSKIVKTI